MLRLTVPTLPKLFLKGSVCIPERPLEHKLAKQKSSAGRWLDICLALPLAIRPLHVGKFTPRAALSAFPAEVEVMFAVLRISCRVTSCFTES